jgi:hypothetical protein
MTDDTQTDFYRTAITKLNLSQKRAAEFLGFSHRQSRRVAGSHAKLDTGAEKLLRVMMHLGLTVAAVDKICGTTPAAKMAAAPAVKASAAKKKKAA